MTNLKLLGRVCHGSKSGLATLMVSNQFFKIKRSWRSERERGTAVLFGAVFVMAGLVLQTARRILDVYETFILSVANILGEGRRAGAKGFYITGDINVELGSIVYRRGRHRRVQ